ncbi:WXG100 family type VII secretion target [Streptomyces sp. 7-21]|jgi:WXG100 family type VII secretion target|uniref:WXG100 family type VII secretion target n=1 Tax=Streptomyces sp. 7-21 TaxID=2802283 RepID=UPI0019202E58|nr:WXG100 family type VII secretion target [Streptomyces sp. 7-21]MBL1068302.1 WXG100 family type VII secretion target [Streptomyces sp. 7-21]
MNINVQYSALDSGAERMNTVAGNLVERLETLQSGLRSVASGWTGEAKLAFEENMRLFTTELDKLRVIQANTATSVSNASAGYAATDRYNARRFGR